MLLDKNATEEHRLSNWFPRPTGYPHSIYKVLQASEVNQRSRPSGVIVIRNTYHSKIYLLKQR